MESEGTQQLPTEKEERLLNTIELPAPTAWPVVLAFGVALLFGGLVTSISVSVLGAVLAVAGCVGWFREVLPHEKHEFISASEWVVPVSTSRPQVARVEWMTQELHRARLPLEIYPVSAGVKGGVAGGVAMAVPAVIYGIISGHGMWYPINLLSAGFFPERSTIAQIAAFHWDALVIATIIHAICSLLVGLLYGVALPMFPRRPSGLKFAKAFTSPLRRAMRTCELAGFGAVAEIDPDLVEWDYGEYEGRRTDEIRAQRPGWQLFRDGCPGGESPSQVAERADRVVMRVSAVPGDVLLFSSGHFLRMLAVRWIRVEPTASAASFMLNTASLSALSYEHDLTQRVIRLWNDDHHVVANSDPATSQEEAVRTLARERN